MSATPARASSTATPVSAPAVAAELLAELGGLICPSVSDQLERIIDRRLAVPDQGRRP